MSQPRRRRSERKTPVKVVAPLSLAIRPVPSVPLAVLVHPSSVEFLAAYNAYFDAYPRWIEAPPLSAASWRDRAIEGWLA